MARVLVLPKWYPWPERPVLGLFCREHARAAALRHDVRVLAFRPERMSGLFHHWTDPAEPLPTERLVYRRPRLRAAAMATQLAGMAAVLRMWRRAGWRPDLIHAHVFEAGFPAVLLGRRLGVPVVVSEHFTAFQRGLVTGSDRLLAQAAFRGAALVCPVSEDLRGQLSALAPQARFRVVPNPVDTALFHPGERRPGGELRLLNVAALAEKKRHADLLDAVARLRQRGLAVRLDVVGDGELAGELAARAPDGVRLLGARPPAEVAELMRAADLFVLASRFENFPVVLLEALASGLPVVATAVGGVPEIVDAAAGRLVAPGDPAALADAIADVAGRLERFDRAALARRARERWSLEAVGAVWDEVYAGLSR